MPLVRRPSCGRFRRLCGLLPLVLALDLAPAAAQEHEPIGPVTIDVRGSLARFPTDDITAASVGLPSALLPGRGLGFEIGGHVYVIRTRAVTIGLGASFLEATGRRIPAPTTAGGAPAGPTVRTRFRALSPQLSVNFGHGRGWSYLSGGIGRSRLSIATDGPAGIPERDDQVRTLNYGGGARWFAKRHLAFTFDLRFYAVGPQPQSAAGAPATPRLTLLVFSAGASFK